MGVLQVIFLILLWGIPIILFTTTYIKLKREEKREIINEIKRPLVLFELGFVIGVMIFLSGSISLLKWIQHVGAITLIASGFTTVIFGWVKREIMLRRGISAIFWLLAFTIAYLYLF